MQIPYADVQSITNTQKNDDSNATVLPKLLQNIGEFMESQDDYKFNRNLNAAFNSDDYLEFEVKRYLRGDFFSIQIDYRTSSKIKLRVAIQINNEIVYESEDLDSSRLNNPLVITHNLLAPLNGGIVKFKEIHHILVTVHEIKKKNTILRQAQQLLINPHEEKNKFVVRDNPILFRVAKTISSRSIIWNNVLLTPIPWDNTSHNRGLFEVYAWNDDDSPVDFDQQFVIGKLKGVPIRSNVGLECGLAPNANFGNGEDRRVGDIVILSNSYYDYAKEQMVLGAGPGSVQGYLIPPTFKGSLFPNIDIGINNHFQKINISREILISNPIFGNSNAQYNLVVEDEGNMVDITSGWITVARRNTTNKADRETKSE